MELTSIRARFDLQKVTIEQEQNYLLYKGIF